MSLDNVIDEVKEASLDQSVPRRIRESLEKVALELEADSQDSAVKVTSAIYEVDEIANDVNIPVHAKTMLWDIISHLESLKSG